MKRETGINNGRNTKQIMQTLFVVIESQINYKCEGKQQKMNKPDNTREFVDLCNSK